MDGWWDGRIEDGGIVRWRDRRMVECIAEWRDTGMEGRWDSGGGGWRGGGIVE